MDKERRRHARYERADLELSVARPGIKGMLSLNPTSECLNFSLAGLQFGCNKLFQPGERLILDLRVYDIEADELLAEVVNAASHEDGTYCICVRFCFEEKRMQRASINHALLQIEDRLRLAEAFPETASFTLDN
ncbi:MAG: hypothetical protein ACFHX7_02815 [Pseudomonadota bacterium]